VAIVFREPPTALDNVRMGGINRLILAAKYFLLLEKHEALRQYQTGIDRLRNTGDYTPGGQFDHMYPGFRDADTTYRQMLWKRLSTFTQSKEIMD